MRTISRSIILPLLLLAIAAPSALAQKKYRVKLDRPRKVGDAYTISTICKTEQHYSMSMQGEKLKEEDSVTTIVVVADAKVTGLDPVTDQPMITYTVKQCTRYDAALDSTMLIAPGTRILYHVGAGGKEFRAADGDVDPEVLDEVDDALSELGSGMADGNIGTTKPQAVGASWKVNGASAARGISGTGGIDVKEKNVKGTARIVEVLEGAPVPQMRVGVTLNIKNFTLPSLENMKTTNALAVVDYLGSYPLDETKGPLGASLRLDFSMKASGRPEPGMPSIELDMQFSRQLTTQYSYE